MAQLARGVAWTYAAIALGAVIQLGVTAVTARLIEPAAFGLVAMANVLISFGGYFAQMGVGRALIQRPEINDDDVRAAFTSSTLLGVLVASIVVLAAPLAGRFFQTEAVVPVVRWLALAFVAMGLGATAQALLRRRLRFKGSGAVDVAAYALGFGLPALVLAFAGFGVWSLVAGAIGQRIAAAVLAYALIRHSLRPTFRLEAHRRLLAFGSKVSIISLLEYTGSMLDTIIIGRFGTATQLGLYNRAFMLASLPMYQILNGINKVLFPVLSGGQHDRPEFQATLHKVTGIGVRILLPVGIGMAMVAPEIVAVVLGPNWTEAVPLFAVLALAMPLNLLAAFPGIALEAVGSLRRKLFVQSAYVALTAVALTAVAALGDLNLFLIVATVAVLHALRFFAYFMLGYLEHVYDPRHLRCQSLMGICTIAVSSLAIGGSVAWTRHLDALPVVTVLAAVATGVLVLALLFVSELLALGRTGRWFTRHDDD